MARYSKIIFILVLISVPLNLFSFDDTQAVPKILELNAEDSYLTQMVTAISERAHYSQSSVNNESSFKILNEYINTLDRSKMYFSQTDINYFQRYRYKLDDSLRDGELSPIFDIFSPSIATSP